MADPYRQFRFKVTVGGDVGGFSEVTVAETTTDPIDYREGNEKETRFRKISGLTKYGNITLKRGTTDSIDFFTWMSDVYKKGSVGSRKNITITLLDEAGDEKASWEVENAWPTKYKPSDLSAKANEIAIETVEFVHEGIKRTK